MKIVNNQSTLYAIIGLLAGVLIGIFVSSYAVGNNMTGMMRMMGLNGQYSRMMGGNASQDEEGGRGMMGMGSSMNDMMKSLENKTGDEFDKSFMESMTVHHQGAIEMAKKAKEMSKRPEILKMASDIISAQTGEIEMMKGWQKEWGY